MSSKVAGDLEAVFREVDGVPGGLKRFVRDHQGILDASTIQAYGSWSGTYDIHSGAARDAARIRQVGESQVPEMSCQPHSSAS